ncbi:hypothetical protein [Chryseobacterium koreense]
MLHFLLMLLGFISPNSNTYAATLDKTDQVSLDYPFILNNADGDTGGEDATIPKK